MMNVAFVKQDVDKIFVVGHYSQLEHGVALVVESIDFGNFVVVEYFVQLVKLGVDLIELDKMGII